MLGVWYFPMMQNTISTVENFIHDPANEGMQIGEQFRSFCFWLGAEGE